MRSTSSLNVRLGGVAIIAIFVAILARPHPQGNYGSGRDSFYAAFTSPPIVRTVDGATTKVGAISPHALKTVIMWSAGRSSVWLATLRGSNANLSQELKQTAAKYGGTFEASDGVTSVHFVRYRANPAPGTYRWTAGVIEVRGSKLYYAQSGASRKSVAQRFIDTFKVEKVVKKA